MWIYIFCAWVFAVFMILLFNYHAHRDHYVGTIEPEEFKEPYEEYNDETVIF